MKKILLTITVLGFLAGSQVQNAKAGDREWAVAGKVLTGIAAASIITHAIAPAPVYAAPAPVYVAPAPVYAAPAYAYAPAAPVVYYQPAAPVVVCPPAPVVVYRQPVYVRPAPVFGFGFAIGREHGFGPRDHGRW